MIGVSKLYCGLENEGDAIRYASQSKHMAHKPHAHQVPKSASERRPVTAWNMTRTCNLNCIHCYTTSSPKLFEGELNTEEGKALIDDLADFQIPALLMSGGEPLVRHDIWELMEHARKRSLRVTLSTNGTLIDEAVAQRIKKEGFIYVGVSLDGLEEVNDHFRGKKGAFRRAVEGFRNLVQVGQRVGLRMTLTRHNFENLHGLFDFIEAEEIDRACFYHLVYSGRGKDISGDDLTHEESREAMDIILERSMDFHKRGLQKDILTVDNHVDGVYIYLKLLKTDPQRAEEIRKLLEWNGGGMYSSGVGFGEVDFLGNVHADQFTLNYSFGNVRDRKFSEIWQDTSDPVMKGLKDRKNSILGRCRKCRFFSMCGGSMRARAFGIYENMFAPDPGCYLTDDEIGLTAQDKKELESAGESFPVPPRFHEKKAQSVG